MRKILKKNEIIKFAKTAKKISLEQHLNGKYFPIKILKFERT